MVLIASARNAEVKTHLWLELGADDDDSLPRHLHFRCGLAQIQVVGDRLGHDRVEAGIVE